MADDVYSICGVPFSIKFIAVVFEVGMSRGITLSRISGLRHIVNAPMLKKLSTPNFPPMKNPADFETQISLL